MWVMDERFDEEGEAERRHLAERIKDKAVREERRAWLVKQGRCNEGDPQGRATEWADIMTGSGTIIWDSQVHSSSRCRAHYKARRLRGKQI